MEMNNKEIRVAIFMYGLKKQDVAKQAGISKFDLAHWLQSEMPEQKKARILKAIQELALQC